jgi:regulating synaptic membrane exocytosis protein 2
LQVTIWGDYGRVEGTKVFMGVAQILLDNLDLSALVIGWYKLFGTSSLVSVPPGGGKADAQVKSPVKSFKWKNDKTNYIQRSF